MRKNKAGGPDRPPTQKRAQKRATPTAKDSTEAGPVSSAGAALDELLVDSDVRSALSYLDELKAALVENDQSDAARVAGQLKEELVTLSPESREQCANALHAQILVEEPALQGLLFEHTGIARPAETLTDPREALVNNLIQTAATQWGTERDELVRLAFGQIANLSELAIDRWRGEFFRVLGVDKQLFARQIRNARSQPSEDARAEVIAGRLCWLRDPLLNCAPMITAERTFDDGLAPEVRLTIEGRLASGEQLPALEILATELASGAWVNRWGARVIQYKRPGDSYIVKRAMQEISLGTMARETVHTFTGWTTIEGKRAFLTATSAIGADGLVPGVRVDLGSGRMNNYGLPEPPKDPRAALSASLAFLDLAPLHVTAPIWAAMFAAPLTELYPFNGVIWIAGKTQSRKTALSTLALAHYGPDFIKGHSTFPPATWEYSLTALEAAWFAAKDVPLLIDNYRPQFGDKGEATRQHAKAETVLSVAGDRGVRGRGRKDGKSREARPPRGLILATSEQPIVGQGVVGRTVNVSVWPDDVKAVGPNNPLDQAQTAAHAKGLYAQAMAAYLQWLAQSWDKATAMASAEHALAMREGYSKLPATQGRLADYYSNLAMAAGLALEFCEEKGAISSKRHTQLADAINQALMRVLLEQARRTSDQSPIHKVCEALSDLVASGRGFILRKHGARPALQPGMAVVGWYDADKPILYLHPGPALEQARGYWQRLGVNLDLLPETLGRDVAGAGLLAERDERQLTVSVYLGKEHGTVRVLVIDADKLEALTSICLYPPKLGIASQE